MDSIRSASEWLESRLASYGAMATAVLAGAAAAPPSAAVVIIDVPQLCARPLMIVGVADTHTSVWFLFGDPRLSVIAKDFIDKAASARRN